MKVMFNKFIIITPLILFGLTLLSFLVLTSSLVSAGDVIDDVSIRVQVSCTMYSNMDDNDTPHSTSVNPGTYKTNIGTTNFKVFCNDNEGFAVYAIGYTDNTDGMNVLTNSSIDSSFDIQTGTGTSGSTSQWAMKLETNSGATYPISIQNSFDSWHTVPNDYTLVAKRTANTDIGVNAEGAGFSSTYQVYASSDQPGGNYNGRVKYVMVHPNDTSETPVKSNQIGVIFDGNGLTFSGGASENRVVYEKKCSSIIASDIEVVKTSNLSADGTKNSGYDSNEHVLETITIDGADRIGITINYGLSWYSTIYVVEGEWGGMSEDGEPSSGFHDLNNYGYGGTIDGSKTFIFEGDTLTVEFYGGSGGWNEGYDYGMYAKIYQVNEIEGADTEIIESCELDSVPVVGIYAETETWGVYPSLSDYWGDDEGHVFINHDEVFDYLERNQSSYYGTTFRLSAHNPYKIAFDGNGATSGTMTNFYRSLDVLSYDVGLASPNFYKSGYGFAGWSSNSSATVNTTNKIYGPMESIVGSELNYVGDFHVATLYAVWVPSAGNLQGWTGCSSLGQGQVTALTDTRDNNTYAVAKLADGNCWMIENLRLDAANSSDSSKAQGFGGVFSGLANSEDASSFHTTNANSKYSTTIITGSNQRYRFPRYNNSNLDSLTISPATSESSLYSYGNHYSWPAAMANTNTLTSASASESANTSICPNGWRLPYGNKNGSGNTSGGFYYLNFKMNNDTAPTNAVASRNMRAYPNNFVMAGYNNSDYGRHADYWTSSAQNGTMAYEFYISNDSAYDSTMTRSSSGSVRCLINGN